MDGVPHILMGQEFGEPTWTGWQVLFDGWQLNWQAFDSGLYAHYQTLIALRRQHPALRNGATTFLDGLPPGAIGFTRDDIVILANLSDTALTLNPALAQLRPLYASGWHVQDTTLAPHGWLIGR
jgi:glycosidase